MSTEAFRSHADPFGEPIPANAHAVSVSLPYEPKDAMIIPAVGLSMNA